MPNPYDLESPDEDTRLQAIRHLGVRRAWWKYRRLIAIAVNREETELVRIHALQAISYPYRGGKIARALRSISFDETESLHIRCQVIEWCWAVLRTNKQLSLFKKLLNHPEPDIRFWTVFALTSFAQHWRTIAPVFDQVEKIAAFDSEVPALWGWHVHREALEIVEHLYFRRYCGRRISLRNTVSMRLISPVPEYFRYQKLILQGVIPPDSSAFTLEKSWLEAQLRRAWPEITFQVRLNSQAYQLSWIVKIDGQRLLGGLHRDSYAVVVTGEDTARNRFICWYREIIADHDLFVYEWGMDGVPLQHGMTPEQLIAAEQALYAN